jgi:hypothetical protein
VSGGAVFFFPFLPSLCVEPSSRSSLPKCSIAWDWCTSPQDNVSTHTRENCIK